MALTTSQQPPALPTIDDSDYGSDLELDDATIATLLSPSSVSRQPLKQELLIDIEDVPYEHEPLQEGIHIRLSQLQEQWDRSPGALAKIESIVREATIEVEYDEPNRNSFSPVRNDEESQPVRQQQDAPLVNPNDKRSPLQRFRQPPKKPLSVTDLVSPAWCEQQYEYSLSKYGRVKRTAAMKQGSKVHKTLEEQDHLTVPVQTVSKEDRFGLRVWNSIESLRRLRETGLTREMEVLGVVEGEVVIGVIDEIGVVCPDEGMEGAILEKAKEGKKGEQLMPEQLMPGQATLESFLTSSQNGSVLGRSAAFLGTLQDEKPRRYYLKDIKTRQTKSVPGAGAASRPTSMQLMLYHRLLSALAANEVSADTIFERYWLDGKASFSDKFIAEIANLNIAASQAASDTNDSAPSLRQDPLNELLEHNTLTSLWSLLITEAALTFPSPGVGSQASISPLLTAEFRTASAKSEDGVEAAAGTVIGQRCFAFDPAVIDKYLRSEMAWWKGERPTVGVEVAEAFKCRICEFADGCVWRATKVEEALRKAQLRKEARRRSEV